MIKIVVIGIFEQSRIRKILSSRSEFEVIGLGNDNYDAIRLIDTKKPDVVVLTSRLENNEDGEIIPLIRSKSPKTAVILLVACTDEERICKAIAFGASAYLLENDMDTLCYAVSEVYHGGCFMSVNVTTKVLPLLSYMVTNSPRFVKNKQQSVSKAISYIELHIMTLVTKGFSTKEIAEKLHMTTGSVRNCISSIMRKTGAQNRNQVGIFVLKNKLITFNERDI
ncbi:MAG: response regulator transcription factor [Treponema sp.]|jgi:DNA-binding NarL/FixJ family response regulator|nr:response regulator transcription factor [Treponema sp.]